MTGRGRPAIGPKIEVRLSDAELDQLRARARAEAIPLAALVREVLRRYLVTP